MLDERIQNASTQKIALKVRISLYLLIYDRYGSFSLYRYVAVEALAGFFPGIMSLA
jgi:hypothetical protein